MSVLWSVPVVEERPVYVLSGGGTGGHLFPGVAVAQELQASPVRPRVVFVGSERSVERDVISQYGFEHYALTVEPLSLVRRSPVRLLRRNWRAYCEAKSLLRRLQPAAVLGLGGYVSVPTVLAASRLRIPVVLLEQNRVAGRATRWLSRRSTMVCLSFDDSARDLSSRTQQCVTGNPVRRSIAALYGRSSDPPDRATLLILGGSQGAAALNEAMPQVVRRLHPLLAHWRVVHQTGKEQRDRVRQHYTELEIECVVEPLLREMAEYYRQATVVVSRAGATTLAELACVGCPAVLVPYPHAADNHQAANAHLFESAGAACVVEQVETAESLIESLVDRLSPLLTSSEIQRSMRESMQRLAQPDAARRVADILQQLANPN